MTTDNTSFDLKYKGVGGWLLLLCLSLTLFSPLSTVFNLFQSYSELDKYIEQFPGLYTISIIDIILSVIIVLFSIYAGISLWRIKKGAVNIAKKYLFTFLVYSIIAAILPFLAGLPSSATEAMIGEIAKNTIRSLIYLGIWYSYLSKSKRVKATYPNL